MLQRRITISSLACLMPYYKLTYGAKFHNGAIDKCHFYFYRMPYIQIFKVA